MPELTAPIATLHASEVLAGAATVYGVIAALAVLMQARQLLGRRSSCDVSVRFFATYAGGYAVWLLYGAVVRDIPLLIVDSIGLVSATVTLAVIVSLRGRLLRPRTWAHC